MEITFRPIGMIHSPFQDLAEMPIQPQGVASLPGTIEIYPDYSAGLKDLDGFSHIILLYYLHKVSHVQLTVIPFLDSEPPVSSPRVRRCGLIPLACLPFRYGRS